MGFDIFVQGFRHGEPHERDAKAIRRALAPYLVEMPNGWNLRFRASDAEIYGVDDLATGFMVTHANGDDIFDLLVHVAAACDLVIYPVGVPAAVTRKEQLDHLPDALRDNAVLVTSGAELIELIKSS
jgi:hypothetical protein